MSAALFVSNGHGEASVAERIALELAMLDPIARLDHLALVGDMPSEMLRDVGPRAAMPSGGLIAMGNVRNIARDLRAGLLGLTLAQRRFLRSVRGEYAVTVAVGDAFALMMALQTRAPAVFVGTAKSVKVAPYGPFEERLLRRAAACFVRDDATARRLARHGVGVEPSANVIADLYATPDDVRAAQTVHGFSPAVALFPGSRATAYEHAAFLLDVCRAMVRAQPQFGAVLSIAGNLEVAEFAAVARRTGWEVAELDDASMPLSFSVGERIAVRTWRGALGPLLTRVDLVLGQAGTANEAAAAAGVPVVAFNDSSDGGPTWYRQRQSSLLGGAMTLLPADEGTAADAVLELLRDAPRRARMGAAGRARMGEPGAARRIAERVARLVGNAVPLASD